MVLLLMYFTWIRNRLFIYWRGDKKGIALVDLPDDCLSEILSRLPSYDILRCRRVCKRLHTLTSSARFIAFQTQRAPTTILILELSNKRYLSDGRLIDFNLSKHCNYWFYLDKPQKNNKRLKKLKLDHRITFTKHTPELLFSFGGLLALKVCALFTTNRRYIVLNPISRKSRDIPWPPHNVSYNMQWTYICGLFFHPFASEFKLIAVYKESKKVSCWYYIYGSATSSWRRINATPLFFLPIKMYDPVVVDMCLHWIVDVRLRDSRINPCKNALMIFNINSEEIYTMPHPKVDGHWQCDQVITNLLDNHEKRMVLFEMDKKLWFAHISRQDGTGMDIWELHDRENWSWVRRYSICKNQIPNIIWTYDDVDTCPYSRPKFLSINKEMLLINWFSRKFYILDLIKKTVGKISDKYISSNRKGLYLCSTYTYNLLIPEV